MNTTTKYVKFTSKKIFTLWQDFVSLFFPLICAACGKNLFKNENGICTSCLYYLPKTNYHLINDNPVEKIFWGRIHIAFASSFYNFNKGGKVQQLIHSLKYKGNEQVGIQIGKIYGWELRQQTGLNTVDLIIPVPLHKKKLRKRGYNQSVCFAEGLSSSMQLEMDSTILFRSLETETQTKKSRFLRWKNVENMFLIKDAHKIRDKHILLVDDVITTGATLEACARALLKAPGVRISIATIACASN